MSTEITDITIEDFANATVISSNISNVDIISSRYNPNIGLSSSVFPEIDAILELGDANKRFKSIHSNDFTANTFRPEDSKTITFFGNLYPSLDNQFDVGIPTQRWRRINVKDIDVSGNSILAGPTILIDANTFIVDDVDPTKQFQFQADTITTGNIRTFSVPDADTTLVGTDVSQTLTNKNITGNTNTVRATQLGTIGSDVIISGATPPIAGYSLIATSPTEANWSIAGTALSVGLDLPSSVFSISGSPVTTIGTLTGNFIPQINSSVFAGPISGGNALPTFRTLLPSDMPGLVISDTLTADVNNYNPTGLSTATQLRLTSSGSSRTVTGLLISGTSADKVFNILTITNVGTSLNVILSNLNAGSSANNQFQFDTTDVVLFPGQSYAVFYDFTTLKWRGISSSTAGYLGGSFITGGVINPPILSTNQNNYNPTGLSNASVIRLGCSAPINITGLAGGVNGRRIVLINVDICPITLKNQSILSLAANRFLLGGSDVTLVGGSIAGLVYDGVTNVWRVQGGTGGAAAGGLIQSQWVEITTDFSTTIDTWPTPNTTITATGTLPTGTITVLSTAGFPTSGELYIQTSNNGAQLVNYTGTTGTTFTGCTGGSGGLVLGAYIWAGPLKTFITAASNNVTLPTGTINVTSTAGYPTSGKILVTTTAGTQNVTYTGITATTFTGCTGGMGIMMTGNQVVNISSTAQDIMRIEMTTSGGAMIISAGASATTKNNVTAYFQVLVDGIVRRGGSTRGNGSAPSGSTIIGLKLSNIAAGDHVVVVRWRVQSGASPFSYIFPVTLAEDNNASLLVQEVSS